MRHGYAFPYAAEEFLVEGHWKDERRLNMIPGGKSGLRFLRGYGILAKRVVPLPDGRDKLVGAWLKEHTRRGLSVLWVAEKWNECLGGRADLWPRRSTIG